jgi:hypothetical protein
MPLLTPVVLMIAREPWSVVKGIGGEFVGTIVEEKVQR